MSLKSDDSQASTPTDLVFILAIAGRIDAQSRIIAKELDNDRSIYYGYAVCDSLSSSYSMFKYFLDVFFANSSNDAMHDLMMTPGGIAAMTLESLFLISFSVLAAKFDNETGDNYKKMIATAWPYFRDIMKGLKNAYKGWRSAIVAFGLLGAVDINFLIIPVGVILGIFAAANRFLVRYLVTEPRKSMMSANVRLKDEIKQLLSLTYEESKLYAQDIQEQDVDTRIFAFLAVGLGGAIDGLYLYVGVLSLAILSSPLLFYMVAMCVFYTVACIITRIYEEYDFQLRLLITQTKCRLELVAKETETVYAKLLALQKKTDKSDDDLIQLSLLKNELNYLLTQFEEQRKILRERSTRTYLSAVLLGLKNGLYVYGALASILFLVGSILTLSGWVFPPALLVVCVSLGLVFITTCIIHSLITNYQHLQKEKAQAELPELLVALRNSIKLNQDLDCWVEKDVFREILDEGIAVEASPQSSVQDRSEVVRSTFSGFGKGQKIISFFGFFLQSKDEQGHYHDSSAMQIFSVFSALIFGIILGLRALARGFGRVPLGQDQPAVSLAPEPVIPRERSAKGPEKGELSSLHESTDKKGTADIKLELIKISKNAKDASTTKVPGESIQQFKSRNDSQFRFDSSRSIFGFFETKASLHRSESDACLISRDASPDGTIRGLG
ncbi:hypothetical protein [Legionella maioricensis]|uniref:Transmembrane protein n=1 Tax=Legionella maioricensis TaxID=2896528 RepID=A0A9X2D0T8_9GAMM|nr:hypothetical protein [Legionella maioricensis]MCL9684520.1 hypothetical protein [Legionella maioricensis]MCL9687886.1 hypothetical protein [Legionella maioricensis]